MIQIKNSILFPPVISRNSVRVHLQSGLLWHLASKQLVKAIVAYHFAIIKGSHVVCSETALLTKEKAA